MRGYAGNGTGSQPLYGTGSQPLFGTGSQPLFGTGSQPLYDGVDTSLQLTHSIYRIAVEWQCYGGKQVDLDLQAVIVDSRGFIVDAVYFNNSSALNGAIELLGDSDEVKGLLAKGSRCSECMGMKMDLLPKEVEMVIFIVAVYDSCHLRDADNGRIVIMQESTRLRQFPLEKSRGDVDMVCYMRRDILNGGWTLRPVNEAAALGSHFLDILEPDIGDLIRREFPSAPHEQRVSFQMQKGAVASLPRDGVLKRLNVCIGGARRFNSTCEVDLDVSAVFYDKAGKIIGAVDGDCSEKYGVSHCGDTAASHHTFDEAINMDLLSIPKSVSCVFLVLTLRSGSFQDVRRAYARITDQTAAELVRYDIECGMAATGLVIAQLVKDQGDDRWGFVALGTYVTTASSWKGAQAEMNRLVKQVSVKRGSFRLTQIVDPALADAATEQEGSDIEATSSAMSTEKYTGRASARSSKASSRCSTIVAGAPLVGPGSVMHDNQVVLRLSQHSAHPDAVGRLSSIREDEACAGPEVSHVASSVSATSTCRPAMVIDASWPGAQALDHVLSEQTHIIKAVGALPNLRVGRGTFRLQSVEFDEAPGESTIVYTPRDTVHPLDSSKGSRVYECEAVPVGGPRALDLVGGDVHVVQDDADDENPLVPCGRGCGVFRVCRDKA